MKKNRYNGDDVDKSLRLAFLGHPVHSEPFL